MNKGLEALKRLEQHENVNMQDVNNDFRTIEKELKRLEELEKAFIALSKEDEQAKKELSKEIEKNRALEIIKEKKINVKWLLNSRNLLAYNNGISYTYQELTQEEYKLLKEVLL